MVVTKQKVLCLYAGPQERISYLQHHNRPWQNPLRARAIRREKSLLDSLLGDRHVALDLISIGTYSSDGKRMQAAATNLINR